jgi:membrane associated rhomboid family serine protease
MLSQTIILIIITALLSFSAFNNQKLYNDLILYPPAVNRGQYYRFLTSGFIHADMQHLLFNMLGIYWFGTMVEMVWKPQRFLFYYFACGLGAWVAHTGIQWWELDKMGIDPTTWNGSMLGASGAVFGIMVAFAMNFPDMEIRLLFPPIAMKAKYFVPLIAVAELMFGIGGVSTGIAHYAHLGGALTGFLLIMFWTKFK